MNRSEFTTIWREVYQIQVRNNPTLKQWHKLVQPFLTPNQPAFLPISQFKKQVVKTGSWLTKKTFESSSTTGTGVSKHHVSSLLFYENISQFIFEEAFGKISNYHVLALLPGYLERNNSSLVYMVKSFVEKAKSGGFFIHEFELLNQQLKALKEANQQVILFGVSHALLDFAEQYPQQKNGQLTVIETGGMKGRRKEIPKSEMHDILKQRLGLPNIAGEYGMTELMSQAYSKKDGIYTCPPSMKVVISDINDPFKLLEYGKRGRINVIDLANFDTCSFIATDDLGLAHANGTFEVLGRIQEADIRGCNQMYR